jgi:hypothetical protein
MKGICKRLFSLQNKKCLQNQKNIKLSIMLQIIRKSSMLAIIVMIAIAASFVTGCQKEEWYPEEEANQTPDWETELWVQSLLNDSYSDYTITTTVSSDGARVTRYEPLISASPRLKAGTEDEEKREEPWSYWGIVDGLSSGARFANAMENTYRDKCYEMRAEPIFDKDGKSKGKKMYHRPCPK